MRKTSTICLIDMVFFSKHMFFKPCENLVIFEIPCVLFSKDLVFSSSQKPDDLSNNRVIYQNRVFQNTGENLDMFSANTFQIT